MKQLFIALGLWILTSTSCQAQVGLFIRPNSSSLSSPVSGQSWLFNSTNNTISVWNGSVFQLASAAQSTYNATMNPTSSDDQTMGYSVGSAWYNTNNGNLYFCISAATSAAVWVQTNNLGGLSIPLSQLEAGGASSGQALVYNGSNWAPGASNILLSQLLQSGASTGQVPIWNGSAWIAGNPPGGSATVPLSQIQQSGATTNQTIKWNGSSWVPTNAGGGLPSGAVNNNLLGYPSGSAAWVYGLSGTASSAISGTVVLTGVEPSIEQCAASAAITLPAASAVAGKTYVFWVAAAIGSGTATITCAGSDHFVNSPNSDTSITLTDQGADSVVNPVPLPVIISSNGSSGWVVMSNATGILNPGDNSNFNQVPSSVQAFDSTGVPCMVPMSMVTGSSPLSSDTALNGSEPAFQIINGSTITITLPPIANWGNKQYYFINISGGSTTIATNSGDSNFDTTGSPSLILTTGQRVWIVADPNSASWWFLQKPN